MKRASAAVILLLFFVLPAFGGTKEDMERMQSEIRALESKLTGFTFELEEMRKRLEFLDTRLEAVSRSSQTADIRADLDQLKSKLEAIESMVADRGHARPLQPAPPEIAPGSQKGTDAAPGETPQQIYQGAHSEYIQGRYRNAVEEFQRFIALFPADPLVENCMYWTGESYYGMKDYGEAKKALSLTMEKYPKGAKFMSAKLKLALTNFHLGEKAESRRLLQEIVSAAPISPEADIAKEKLSTLFPD